MLNETERRAVIELVLETEKLISRELEAAKVTVKGAADYVTNVDYAVQEFLRRELAERFPQIRMIAEEKENRDLDREGCYWILDPIDGTTNLIYHYGMSCVSLGLYERGTITFGVVYNPFHGELFHAAAGEGAFLNGEKIHADDSVKFENSVISYGSSPYEKEKAEILFPIFKNVFLHCADFRRSGSAALDLCYVACNRQQGYIELNLKPWDYSAGSLILTEAGGIVRQWSGKPLPYLTNSDVFASTRGIEKELERCLAV